MAAILFVNPSVLRDVAAEEKAVASAAGNTGSSSALEDAAAGMSGLHTAGGCQAVRATLDAATQFVGQALRGHSDNLGAAARQYESTDARFGSRLRQAAP